MNFTSRPPYQMHHTIPFEVWEKSSGIYTIHSVIFWFTDLRDRTRTILFKRYLYPEHIITRIHTWRDIIHMGNLADTRFLRIKGPQVFPHRLILFTSLNHKSTLIVTASFGIQHLLITNHLGITLAWIRSECRQGFRILLQKVTKLHCFFKIA